MGIIVRQSIKSTIYSYAGVIVGFVTVALLMPRFLSKAEIGVIRQIQYYGLFLSSILTFGIPQSLVRMFPHFKNQKNNNYGIATLILIFTGISILLFSLLFLNYGSFLLADDLKKSELFSQYYHLILPFTIATILFTLFDSYATANQESTIGVFLRDFVLRTFVLGIVTLYILVPIFDYSTLLITNVYIQFVPVLLLILFLAKRKLTPLTSKISFPSIKIRNEFFSTSAFNWINGLSAVAVVSIDSIMLSKLTNSDAVGVYTTVTFFASLMLIPNKNLGKIASSVIAGHFKTNNLDSIKSIYKKSAFLPFVLGLFLFGNLVLAIPFIFDILLKGEYNTGIWVLVFLALSNLFKMSTGVKFSIIFNSEYYRWSTIMFMIFVAVIVITNYIFIPKFGISGAAIASLIATTFFHAAGLVFVKAKFGYWPFDQRFLKLSLIFTLFGGAIFYIPDFDYPVISSIIKSGIFSSLFLGYMYISKLTPEINEYIDSLIKKLKNRASDS